MNGMILEVKGIRHIQNIGDRFQIRTEGIRTDN
jgi:hypothetical protein